MEDDAWQTDGIGKAEIYFLNKIGKTLLDIGYGTEPPKAFSNLSFHNQN